MHRRTGEQVSGTTRPCDPVRERANKVFGKRSARLLKFVITARLPGQSSVPRATRLTRRLLRSIAAAKTAPTASSSAADRYVRFVPISYSMSVVVDILLHVLLLFMLINTSSMFEFHMHVAVVVMIYILELIMEIMPNNPTV